MVRYSVKANQHQALLGFAAASRLFPLGKFLDRLWPSSFLMLTNAPARTWASTEVTGPRFAIAPTNVLKEERLDQAKNATFDDGKRSN